MSKSTKILALALALIMAVTGIGFSSINAEAAAASAGKGKYVADVYFAYAKTEEEAVEWLKANGWEPIKGSNNFNAGKESTFDNAVAVAMGIKRTDKADEAITDMAVMNMKGGYSFPDYEDLLNEKKAEIDEFINNFIPVLEEYRANYNGQGSKDGKARADMAYATLNQFYDGSKDDPYAKNDTGLPIGQLLLQPTKQEGNASGGDLQQILLESSGGVVFLIEQMLTLGADDSQNSWLTRLSELSGDGLIENLEKYVPEAAGQNVSASVATQYLNQAFGDTAKTLAEQWFSIHNDLVWFEDYCTKNSLWQKDGEAVKTYQSRVKKYFDNLKKKNAAAYDTDYSEFVDDEILYTLAYATDYKGEWGDTLGDFFNPADDKKYGDNPDNFLPFAAALSKGQRAAAELISFRNLLFIGTADAAASNAVKADATEALGGSTKATSVYFGINRAVFRGGAALTDAASMAEAMGAGHAFDWLYDNTNTYAIASYAAAGVGLISLIAGTVMANSDKARVQTACDVDKLLKMEDARQAKEMAELGKNADEIKKTTENYNLLRGEYKKSVTYKATGYGWAARGLIAIGGILLIGAAVYNGYRFYDYYQKTFTPIPTMIVDEADIVTYTDDGTGNSQKTVSFDQYAYYEVAKSNRQAVGKLDDWQSGVESYQEWGCGDAVDLNADYGQEWLSLYTIRNTAKGNPILADSLTLQYGSSELPKNCTKSLHFFTYTNAADLGDTAYAYNNDQNGVYFFWNADTKAVPRTASTFGAGQMALAGGAGIVLGALAATLVLTARKKKKEEQAA